MDAKIIILGTNHHNTYGIIRSLAQAGLLPNVIIFDEHGKCYFQHSKYCKKIYFAEDEKSLLSLLKSLSEELRGSVVIAASDYLICFLDKHYYDLSLNYSIPSIVRHGSLEETLNKDTMAARALECGLHVPSTIYTTVSEAYNIDVKFPCIIKPVDSLIGTKNDIEICKERVQFISYLDNTNQKQIIIQDYIDKEFEYQLIGLSLNQGESIILPGLTRLVKATLPTTNTGVVRVEHLSKYHVDLESVNRFIQSVGYSGLFSIEFLRDKSGRDYFLEMNFRNDGNTICMFNAGVNLPLIWTISQTGGSLDECEMTIKEATTMPLYPFLKQVVKRSITLRDFLRYNRESTCYMDVDFKDWKPIVGKLLRR